MDRLHQLIGHEFEQAPGDSAGQGGLVCCSHWGRKESDVTEQLNSNNTWASLVAQWLRIHLPMRETWIPSTLQEDPTCLGTAEPTHHRS